MHWYTQSLLKLPVQLLWKQSLSISYTNKAFHFFFFATLACWPNFSVFTLQPPLHHGLQLVEKPSLGLKHIKGLRCIISSRYYQHFKGCSCFRCLYARSFFSSKYHFLHKHSIAVPANSHTFQLSTDFKTHTHIFKTLRQNEVPQNIRKQSYITWLFDFFSPWEENSNLENNCTTEEECSEFSHAPSNCCIQKLISQLNNCLSPWLSLWHVKRHKDNFKGRHSISYQMAVIHWH